MSQHSLKPTERRSFLTRFHLGAASVAALALGGIARAQTKAAPRPEPARHEKDDWLDSLGTKHRMVVDTVNAAGFSEGLLFANNFMLANRNDYGLQNADIGLVVIARHLSTGYGFNDAMWAKYGASLGSGPADGKEAPKANPSAQSLANLASQGVHFAICSMATRRLAGQIARGGGNADAIFAELSANTVANGHMAAAGIIAVNRAQERGYTFVSA